VTGVHARATGAGRGGGGSNKKRGPKEVPSLPPNPRPAGIPAYMPATLPLNGATASPAGTKLLPATDCASGAKLFNCPIKRPSRRSFLAIFGPFSGIQSLDPARSSGFAATFFSVHFRPFFRAAAVSIRASQAEKLSPPGQLAQLVEQLEAAKTERHHRS
jgi:hypothetical protein